MPGAAVAGLLAELTARGIELQAEGGRLRFKPAAAMTPDLAERVQACKPELLSVLAGSPKPPAGGQLETHADREWRRFLAVCRPRPDGCGWYDPAASGILAALARASGSSQTRPRKWLSPVASRKT